MEPFVGGVGLYKWETQSMGKNIRILTRNVFRLSGCGLREEGTGLHNGGCKQWWDD